MNIEKWKFAKNIILPSAGGKFYKPVSMAVAGAICVSAILTGCSFGNEKMQTSTLFAMDTVMELQVYGGDEAAALLQDAEQQIRNLEKELSVTDDSSEIAYLNANGHVQLSDEPAQIMEEALQYCESTDGALDITIYPVLKAWGFTTGEYKVPSNEEIAQLLQNVDYRNVELKDYLTSPYNGNADSPDTTCLCTISEGTQVDLGSVTKGYTSRKLASYFRENGVTSGLINLGGNVECIGTKPNGDSWNVAVKSPFKDSDSGILGVVKASDEAIITSGGYERFFEEDGETYWHIIDPSTGKPAKNGLISVTIIGTDGLMCDALSTALFVKGLDGAVMYYHTNQAFDMILVTDAGEVYVTKGVSDRFTLSSEYYDLKLNVIE